MGGKKTTVKENGGIIEDSKKQEKEKLAGLLKKLIGDRSIRQAAIDTGVSAPYISGMLRGQYLPSAEILKKMSAPESKPRFGVTLEDLMCAAGYQEYSVDDALNKYFNNENTPNKDRIREIARYETMAEGAVYKALREKGIEFSGKHAQRQERKGDMVVFISEKNISEWWFEIRFFRYDRKKFYRWSDHFLGQLIFVEPKEDMKISIVINDEEYYNSLLFYKNKMSYRGELSVILLDEESLTIKKEDYLSHFHLDDDSSEFYLV